MASQRSLPFSPSTPIVPVSQRPSQLPSSLSTVGLSTKFENPTSPRSGNASNSASSRHARSGSAVSSASRPRPSPSVSADLTSPTRRTFTGSHAHGILPPPPFLHPSRPPQPPLSPSEESPRSSVDSSNAIPASPSHEREGVHPTFPLQPLVSHDVAYESDGHSDTFHASGDRTSRNSWHDASNQLRNQKQSREPLLPISGHAHTISGSSTTTTHRSKPPSLARNVVEKNAANAGAAARVRDSFERFRKGLSLESVRRSWSGASQSPVTPDLPSGRSTSNGPSTPFEIKETSEEGYKASVVIQTLDVRHRSSANFIPHPPTTKSEYPLSSVPMKRDKSSRYVRNYERIGSSNRWFLRGYVLMGGAKPWAFMASLALVFGIAGVWMGTTSVWWWHNKSPAVAAVGVYMCLLTISLMLSTVGHSTWKSGFLC